MRKVVSNGIGEQEKEAVYKKKGSGDEGNNEGTKKVRDSNVVLCSGVGMSRLSAEIGDFSQSRGSNDSYCVELSGFRGSSGSSRTGQIGQN